MNYILLVSSPVFNCLVRITCWYLWVAKFYVMQSTVVGQEGLDLEVTKQETALDSSEVSQGQVTRDGRTATGASKSGHNSGVSHAPL